MAAPTRLSFRSGGLTLAAYAWGAAEAAPVLVLHGGLDHARAWDETCAALATKRRLIALDLRGHGDSDWARDGAYDPPLYIFDVLQVVRALDAGPVAIIGHSMGAMIAMRLAAAFPELVSRMVLIEGVIGEGMFRAESVNVDPRMQAWIDARKATAATSLGGRLRSWLEEREGLERLTPRAYPTLEAAAARLLEDRDKRLTPAQAAHIAATGMKAAPRGDGFVWKFDPLVRAQFSLDITSEQIRAQWRELKPPILHVHGALSWALPIDPEQRACFPDARFEVLPDAGHWPHLNQPQRFIALAEEFLAS
jgi:pimeloyl-ACP methyl ester carboxylesterase